MIPPTVYIVGGAAIAGFLGGWTVCDWRADSRALAATNALIETKDKMQAKVDAGSDKFEAFRNSLPPQREIDRTTIREAYRDVPVPADCAIRPAALGVLEDARRRANAATLGQFGGPVPADRPAGPASGS